MSLIQQKCHQGLHYYVDYLISQYQPCDRQSMLTCVNNKTVFILHDSFLLYFWIHKSQITQISTIRMKLLAQDLKRYMTTCFQIWSWIIIYRFFGYVLGLYMFYSCICQLSTYFSYGKFLKSTVIWFLIELNGIQPE